MDYKITLYHDKRRSISNSKSIYPVKLRVYNCITKKAKLYSTNINLDEASFALILDASKSVKGKKAEQRKYLNEFLNRAENAAKDLSEFTFNKFESKLFRSKNASVQVAHHYQNKIDELYESESIRTAKNYELSLTSLGTFVLGKTSFASIATKKEEVNRALKKLTFHDIDAKWLQKYEDFMVKDNEKSYTTVSIYLRCLRTIFNDAIRENDIKQDIYPFGRGKYQIPNAQKKRKALTKDQLNLLFHGIPEDADQQKAKDIWFLSYSLQGLNMKDILTLRGENVLEDRIHYFRQKTLRTKKGNLKEITIFLNEYSKRILETYGKKNPKPKEYVFDVLKPKDNAKEQERKIKNFISHVNHFFDKYARSLGFDFKISTYWARHSFATISIRKGASMEFISEALNHSNLNVTKQYFAGFEDETKKEFVKDILDFN